MRDRSSQGLQHSGAEWCSLKRVAADCRSCAGQVGPRACNSGSLLMLAPATHDRCRLLEDAGIVRQGATRHLQFSQRAIVIAIRLIKMVCARQVRLACVRSQPKGGGNRSVASSEPGRGMISTQAIERVRSERELAVGGKEGGVTRQGLIEQVDPGVKILRRRCAEGGIKNQVFGPAIEFKSADISSGALLNRTFLRRREPGF